MYIVKIKNVIKRPNISFGGPDLPHCPIYTLALLLLLITAALTT